MVEIISSFEDLCRLCAGKIDVLMGVDIFASDHRQIFKKICVCLPIQVSVDDSFPKMVCVECACKLDQMFDFRERSILTANLFSDMMTVNNSNSISLDQNISNGSLNVTVEHDCNNDFISCKMESVKYNNELPSDICATASEPNFGEKNIAFQECQDSLPKVKSKPDKQASKRKMNEDKNGKNNLSDDIKHSNQITIKNSLVPSTVFQHPDIQSLNDSLSKKKESNVKLDLNLINSTETNQNLNNCSEMDWFICSICNTTFSNKEEFQLHKHESPPQVTSKIDVTSEEILNVENHPVKKKKIKQKKTVKIKGSDKKVESKVCMECGKQYQTNYKLQEHMRKHTGEKPFLCSYEDCRKAFRSKIGLAQHEANHSGQFEFSCSTCGKGFQCKSYLVVHQRVHSDLKPFICKQCSRKFKTKQSLLDHMNRHLGVKPFLCDICGRGFITKGLCKSHQKVHSGTDNRQYPCNVCRKLFVSKSYLNTHFRIHTGEKPFICEVCGKGFLTRVDLRIHSTMHTGEKSFVCEMCGKAFARRDALRCHRRSHTGERPYKCEFCGQSFTQFSPMAIHKRLHTGERPYECDVCRKRFVSRSTMIAHKKKHHTASTFEHQFQFVEVEVQREEIIGDNEQPSEQLVVVEDSPQLLLALDKRHTIMTDSSSQILTLHKLKNEGSRVSVE